MESKKETFDCFVYGEEVPVIDGVCQEDCSIEECLLNQVNHMDNRSTNEGAGIEDQ